MCPPLCQLTFTGRNYRAVAPFWGWIEKAVWGNPRGQRGFLRKSSGKQKPKMSLESILLLSGLLSKITFPVSVTWRGLSLRNVQPESHSLLCLPHPLTPNDLLCPGVCTSSTRSPKSSRWAWLSQYCRQRSPELSSRSASREANSRDWSDQLTEESRRRANSDNQSKLAWWGY